MASNNPIRWTEDRSYKLKKEIENYNRRIKAAQKRMPDAVLPPLLKVSEVKTTIQTAAELNNLIYDLQRATAATLSAGYEQDLQSRANSRKTRTVLTEFIQTPQQLQFTEKKEPALDQKTAENVDRIDLERRASGRFLTERDFVIKNIGLAENQSPQEKYNRIQNWISSTGVQRAEQWRDNYLTYLAGSMEIIILNGQDEEYEKLQKLYDRISTMDITDFIIANLAEPAYIGIGQLIQYDPTSKFQTTESEIPGRVDLLIETWEKYL